LSVDIAKAKTRERVPYVVRLQAQGGGLERSVVLANVDPIFGLQGTAGLAVLGAQLSKRQLEAQRTRAVQRGEICPIMRAEAFILNAAAAGGIGPPGKSFAAPGSDVRIDVEILNGRNFTR
jgi:hypothetical protein